MDSDEKIESFINKVEPYLTLIIIASFVGVVGGVFGALFLTTLDAFKSCREALYYVIFAMPLIGIIIVYLTKKYKCNKSSNKLIHDAITKEEDIPGYIAPILFFTTTLSHLVGASIGRLEAPIKIGGSIGNYISKFFNLTKKRRKTIIASGVAAFFSSAFGTPVTATVLAYELCYTKKEKKPVYLMPLLLSACFSRFICFAFGLNSFVDRILYINHPEFRIKQIFLILVLTALCLIFTLIFIKTLKYIKNIFQKIKNEYIRIIIGSLIMIGCIILLDTTIFCGNDTSLIKQALQDNSMWYIFAVKTILTAICIGAGFKGGDIGPAFIAGVTFGVLMASLMGIDPMMGAAIGAVCLFGGVTGCYISAIVLGIEIFGLPSVMFYVLIAIIIKYLINNNYIEKQI